MDDDWIVKDFMLWYCQGKYRSIIYTILPVDVILSLVSLGVFLFLVI